MKFIKYASIILLAATLSCTSKAYKKALEEYNRKTTEGYAQAYKILGEIDGRSYEYKNDRNLLFEEKYMPFLQ
jgi:hypothetical protein